MVSNIVSYIMLGAVLVAVIAFTMVQGRKVKKAQDDYSSMLDSLRPGVKVKMASGLLGRIKDIREEAPGFKTVTLNIGDDKNVVPMTFVIDAVQGIVNEEALNRIKLAEAEEKMAEVTVAEEFTPSTEAESNIEVTKEEEKEVAPEITDTTNGESKKKSKKSK